MDMPVDDVYFIGCPSKASVKIRPTQRNCLIAVSEFPPFVVDVNDIEAVAFERVQFGIKNFDMAIIFKNFMTFMRINSMPRECIDELKENLDSVGNIFSESVTPLNWNAVLAKIRSDVDAFIADGAWKFLNDDDDEAAGDQDGSEEDDPEFDAEEEGEDASDDESESDYSDDEDDDEDESEPYGSEESAADWDEMDRKALEEDKKAAQRRAE